MKCSRYKRDGTPYTGANELMEWARDYEDPSKRVVEQTRLWNGLRVSTIWTELPALTWPRPLDDAPLIFETMIFDDLNPESDIDCRRERYAYLVDSMHGHRLIVNTNRSILNTIIRWLFDAMRGMES